MFAGLGVQDDAGVENWLMRLEKMIQQSAKESRKFVDADAVLGEEEC
jgi:hypothetical protein